MTAGHISSQKRFIYTQKDRLIEAPSGLPWVFQRKRPFTKPLLGRLKREPTQPVSLYLQCCTGFLTHNAWLWQCYKYVAMKIINPCRMCAFGSSGMNVTLIFVLLCRVSCFCYAVLDIWSVLLFFLFFEHGCHSHGHFHSQSMATCVNLWYILVILFSLKFKGKTEWEKKLKSCKWLLFTYPSPLLKSLFSQNSYYFFFFFFAVNKEQLWHVLCVAEFNKVQIAQTSISVGIEHCMLRVGNTD